MTDNRYRWGENNPVKCRVESAHAIEIGDLVYLDSDSVRSAGDLTAASLTLAQQALHDVFVGVALQRHTANSGIVTDFVVATSGVFEFPCASATFELGALIGCDDDGSNDPVADQVIAAAGGLTTESIGICAQREGTATTSVFIKIISTIMDRGVQNIIT
jgi:hypothetical protein